MSPTAGHQVVTRRELPRVTVWLDSALVHDSAAPCDPAPPVQVLKINTTAGRDSWRDDVQPGQLTMVISVEAGAELARWTVGATVAIGLHARKLLGGWAREWLGVWAVQDVRSTPDHIGARWDVTITGTDYVGVAATTPAGAAVTWRESYAGPLWASSMTDRPDGSKLDEIRSHLTPIGTVAAAYSGSPPDSGDLGEDLEHGWAAVRLHRNVGQTLNRPGGPLKWLPVTVDLCQIVAGTMTWQLTTAGNVDTVIATVSPLLGDAYDVRLSTWTPQAGHPEQVWTLDGYWLDPMNALAVAVEALAATSGGARWDLAEAVVDLAVDGPHTPAEAIGLHAPWSQVTLSGALGAVAPAGDIGPDRTVERVAHSISNGEHVVTLTLGDPLPIRAPYRYMKTPALVSAALVVDPPEATFEGATAWEHADRTFAEIGQMGTSL